ncbi:hypothetical protein ScPMuIL_012883 [Solemya velum]
MTSCFHLVAVTVTRYIAIVFPMRRTVFLTTNCAIPSIAMLWVAAAATTFSIYSITKPEYYQGVCRYEMIYSQTQIYLFSAIQFVAPLVTMIGLYAKIIATVKEKARVRVQDKIRKRTGLPHEDNRPLVMVSILLGWYTMSYLPMCAYFLVVALCTSCHVSKYIRYSY